MSNPTDNLTIFYTEGFLDAVKRVESSRFQVVFVIGEKRKLMGLVTNGDLRRHIIAGGKSTDRVTACMNSSFRSVDVTASREEILKLLDLGFHVIPRLDEEGNLVDFVTADYDLASPEGPVLARARAPARISFSGGGSDLTYYFIDRSGAVISTSVALYSHATLVPRGKSEINIYSEDLDTNEGYASLMELLNNESKGLLSTVVSVIKPAYGFDLYVRSDFPVGSGLGGSSAVATAIVAAFNEMRLDRWTTYEVAELAFQAERLCFGIVGGWQDQYASAFGGFNLIEFDGKKNLVHSIRMEPSTLNELEQCLLLCDTGIHHDSSSLHVKQRESVMDFDKTDQLAEIVEIARQMHRYLVRGELLEFGMCLNKTWKLKRGLSSSVSDSQIDNIYDLTMDAGALGGKLLGAGGGGFFLFFVQPQFRRSVVATLRSLKCKVSQFRFENEGVTSWRTKIL